MKAERQTRLKLRKGFANAPLTYKVLSVDQLSELDKRIVTKQLAKLTNPLQAKQMVQPGAVWGYRALSLFPPECGLILYKGVHVAIFFKRTTEEIEPLPCDPVPAGALENPDDVWIKFDLLGKSARQVYADVRGELEEMRSENAVLRADLNAADRILAAKEQTIATLNGKLKDKKKGR